MYNIRNIILLTLAVFIFGAISFTFWKYTMKDFLPTILPKNYERKKVNDAVSLQFLENIDKPVYLHFFNPECPCSRFNLDHVRKLIKRYNQKVEVRIVLQVDNADYDWQKLEKEEELKVNYLIDNQGEIASSCGVYSTPQAVIITSTNKLYYRGNYNQAKYCTLPESNFAQMAIDSVLVNVPAPDFGIVATLSYGCQLPQKTFNYGQ